MTKLSIAAFAAALLLSTAATATEHKEAAKEVKTEVKTETPAKQ